MATFEFSKDVNDIEEPQLLPEDWYIVEVTKEPDLHDNRKKQDGATYEEGAGQNLIVSVKVISEDEEFNGAPFNLYLPYPQEEDKNYRNPIRQNLYDAKMQRITDLAEACGSGASGTTASISKGDRFQAYVVQQKAFNSEDIINSVDTLRAGFRSA